KVTVDADRTITVKPGDSLSKYSMAIWGDFNHLQLFWRKKDKNGPGWERVIDGNKDQITAGDTLYLGPAPPENHSPSFVIDVRPPQPSLQAEYYVEFLDWIKHWFVATEWRVVGNEECDFGVSFVTGGYTKIDLQDNSMLAPQPARRYYAVNLGLAYGW